jgi:pyrrolysine biosynthesis protein PylC
MDVEAIMTPKGLRILEIDARIPSQTPAAIEAATGVNLLAELVASSTGTEVAGRNASPGASIYRHVVFENGVLRSSGEKVFGKVRSPRIEEGLFGADRIITDYEPGKENWRGTIIVSGSSAADAEARSDAVISRMMDACSVDSFEDGVPEVV